MAYFNMTGNRHMCRAVKNTFRNVRQAEDKPCPASFARSDIAPFHASLPAYRPTPLYSLPGLARSLGIGELRVKDESERFGLKAFKALGATYAVYRFLTDNGYIPPGCLYPAKHLPPENSLTFCTATDGNHGRAVAYAARLFGQKAVIFMPMGTVPARIANIEAEGAGVVVVEGNYDAAVAAADKRASVRGWQVIADTAYPGYKSIPDDIMAGYCTLFDEITGQWSSGKTSSPPFDFVFLQGGVGSFAAAGACYYFHRYGPAMPRLIVVEPMSAACLQASADSADGHIVTTDDTTGTIMAGLNCPTPSLTAWPILRRLVDTFLSVPDAYARQAMRQFYQARPGDKRIISGESGAAGLAGLMALVSEASLEKARRAIGISSSSRVLIINTEGDTDPVHFRRIISDM